MPATLHPMRRCGALRSNGEPCRKWATNGTNRCFKHGAGAPHVKAAAKRRFAAQVATADLAEMGVAIEVTPPEALEGLLHETAGMVVAAREKVRRLDSLGMDDPETLKRYDDERDRLQRFAKDYTALGIAERQQALRETEIDQLYQAMLQSIAVLPDAQRVQVESDLKRRLVGLVAIEATAT